MNIEICKWKNNANSPVMFMIDDLANVWIDSNGSGKVELREDWGYAKYNENSSMKFLEEKILKQFSQVKVNFYVPVGKRIGMIKDSDIYMYSNPINEDQETKSFFRSVHKNPRYELSYHGLTHGEVFEEAKDQKQEWECYKSLEEALEIINKGKKIFKEVTGENPKGGKYCGYKTGKYGDESINHTNFLWWHRYWNKGIETGESEIEVGSEKNPLKSYDIISFGDNKLVDIPSTLSGSLFNNTSKNKIKWIIKKMLSIYFYKNKVKELDFLLENKLVVSIQEHISPARDDGKIQTPNIFDDRKSLIKIFKYLKNKNVWYCTGTELAEYYILRENLEIEYIDENKFILNFLNIDRKLENMEVTLEVEKEVKEVAQPNGKKRKVSENGAVNVEVLIGEYELRCESNEI